ncbi:MAG: hypothetical protein ABJN69_17650 [Hellea sp.]
MFNSSKSLHEVSLSPGTIRVLSAACLFLSMSLSATAQQAPQRGDGERRGPPPEAYAACASAALNDSCSVETPRETLAGTCKTDRREQRLLCVPEGMDRKRPRRGHRSEEQQDSADTPAPSETE